MAIRPKEKLYKGSLRNLWLLSLFSLPPMAALVYLGLQGLRFFPVEAEDPMRYVAGHLPIGVAATLALGMSTLFAMNFNRRVGTHPTWLLYQPRPGRMIKIRWEDLLFTPPRPDLKTAFPVALFSDGRHFFQIERFFFPDFQEICEVVQQTRDSIRGEGHSI